MKTLKPITKMTNEELNTQWVEATKWTVRRMQAPKSKLNGLGQPYNHEVFTNALRKIENMEDEMQKRGLVYG